MVLRSFLFPAVLILLVAGPEGGEEPSGESPPPDSDPFSDAEFAKVLLGCQEKFAATADRRL
jgi:hypothetical protein